MANEAYLNILKQGVEAWNKWRDENPGVMKPDLRRADLGEADFTRVDLSRADLFGSNLLNANLSQAILLGTSLVRADLDGANLAEANLLEASLRGTHLSQADLSQANLSRANVSHADLRWAELGGAYLSGANLHKADLRRANLSHAILYRADLSGANLSGTDLRTTDLRGADLSGANLNGTNLSGVDLRGADLSGADLSRAELAGTNLSRADLGRANLTETNLTQANLTGTLLRQAVLVQTNLTGANLSHCSIYGMSAWDLIKDGAIQTDLVITPPDEPIVLVSDIELAQFINLLLNQKKSHRNLNAITKKNVLILGRFGSGGLEVLQAIAAALRALEYLPILCDSDKADSRDYGQMVELLAGLSRFTIADLSEPTMPPELYAAIPHLKNPFVPIVKHGRDQSATLDELLDSPWVLNPFEFESRGQLLEQLAEKVIGPAEERYQDRQKLLDQLI
jgi:uncharacterized protein YjbI with pentapeptide repeats